MLSPHEMETMLRNVDLRTNRLEQILPTLATKEDLSAAIALLATKEDLREGLAEARRHAVILNEDVRGDVEMLAEHLLATKEELREGLAEARRHAVILIEAVRDDVRMLAEHLAGVIERGFRKQ